MDEDRRRVREYYQVNLDTGRIFWIAFLLGLVLVGILILGIYVGGGKLKKGLTLSSGSDRIGGESLGGAPEAEKRELPFLNLFDNNLSAETKYIDTKEAEKSALESSKETIESARLFEGGEAAGSDIGAAYEMAERGKVEPAKERAPEPAAAKPPRERYVERGDYFIQVAAFTKSENAENLAGRLRKKLYRVTVEEATVGDQRFYRVRVGPFETKSVAVNTMTTMKKHFDLKDPFVLKKES